MQVTKNLLTGQFNLDYALELVTAFHEFIRKVLKMQKIKYLTNEALCNKKAQPFQLSFCDLVKIHPDSHRGLKPPRLHRDAPFCGDFHKNKRFYP